MFTIRPYRHSDEDALVAVWLASTISGQSFVPESYWRSQEQAIRETYLPAAETIIAEKEGRLVGFLSLLDDLIGGLFVHPVEQGAGVGRQLVRAAERLRQRPLSVEVFEKNARARAFYRKMGFSFESFYMEEETGEKMLFLSQG